MKNFLAALLACILLPSAALAMEIAGEHANPQPFTLWLQEFKNEASTKGIRADMLEEAFATTSPIERIIELDRKQPEGRTTLAKYLRGAVNSGRIATGSEMLAEYRELLAAISKKYGVQPEFIIALWGIETSFGTYTGDFSIVDALATLAYDGRRSTYFRGQLIYALQIAQSENIPASEMLGSWAGAMGQCQFMPESFIKYAVDYNGDGKRDIWDTQEDVFASIANYLHTEGWNPGEDWGFPVSLPAGFDTKLADIKQTKPIKEWQRLGVRQEGGESLPTGYGDVSLILVGEGADAVPHIVTSNYKVILKWNRSRFFATAVGNLSDQIKE